MALATILAGCERTCGTMRLDAPTSNERPLKALEAIAVFKDLNDVQFCATIIDLKDAMERGAKLRPEEYFLLKHEKDMERLKRLIRDMDRATKLLVPCTAMADVTFPWTFDFANCVAWRAQWPADARARFSRSALSRPGRETRFAQWPADACRGREALRSGGGVSSRVRWRLNMVTGKVQRTKKVAEAIAHAVGTLAVVLIGPSSSGKTVLARSIAKLYSKSHGCHALSRAGDGNSRRTKRFEARRSAAACQVESARKRASRGLTSRSPLYAPEASSTSSRARPTASAGWWTTTSCNRAWASSSTSSRPSARPSAPKAAGSTS